MPHPPTTSLAPETFLRAIPTRIWDLGLDFQPWSPFIDATKAVPEFKIILELRDIPVRLWREDYVMKMVSSFGLYLGTISPANPGDYSAWTVVVATDSLERIPKKTEVFIGGLRSVIRVLPVKWAQAPIYGESDLPRQLPEFIRPLRGSSGSPEMSDEMQWSSEEEMISIPRRLVLDMCKGKDPMSLPGDLQAFLNQPAVGMPVTTEGSNGGGSDDYQPLGLSLIPMAAEDPGFNNPKDASPARALMDTNTETDLANHSPHVTILKRQPVPIATHLDGENETIVHSNPGSNPQRIRADRGKDILSLGDSPTKNLTMTENIPSEASDGGLNSLLISMCPQNTRPPINQYGLRSTVKRKNDQAQSNEEGGPSRKRGDPTQGDQAELKLGLDGYYECKVSNSFCQDLAIGWGLLPEVVRREVERDNLERRTTPSFVLETQPLGETGTNLQLSAEDQGEGSGGEQ